MLRKNSSQAVLSLLLGGLLAAAASLAQADEFEQFDKLDEQAQMGADDSPVEEDIVHPSWFKFSFLDLRDDLQEAKEAGKKGIALYFGQKNCAYCKALMEINFKTPDIVRFTRKNFDIIPIDIWGGKLVTDLNGVTLSERKLAVRENMNFTPSFLVFDADGNEVLRLRGYYPPYTFRAALRYVAEGSYKEESLRAYMDRADPPGKFDLEDMNEQTFFLPPPYALGRSKIPAERPLIVFFEQKACHACDILHTGPIGDKDTVALLKQFDTVQLDARSDAPVVTPTGERTTANEWARQLNIFYTPALIFFDERGREILRLDSVTRLYRLKGVMKYVLTKAYEKYPTYLEYRYDRSDAF
jgi:thioredoxin-related protein